jgi:uncharacterized protein (TIGR02246 family)
MPKDNELSPLAAVHDWVRAFNDGDVKQITSLYADDAVLWGTLASSLITSPPEITSYFERALQGKPSPSVSLEEVYLQSFEGTAIASGSYLLNLTSAGQAMSLPARFTFTYKFLAGAWRIMNHHSSLVPSPNQVAQPGNSRGA